MEVTLAAKRQAKKTKVFRARLSERQFNKLYAFAQKHEVTMTHVLHEYIRRLPNPEDEESFF